jgi:hypothetical protein
VAADQRLLEEWREARNKGVRMKDFAKERGLASKNLEQAVDRERQRKRKPPVHYGRKKHPGINPL